MEDKLIQVLIQGGLASVALVSVYLNYKVTTNHLDHSNQAMRELAIVIGELKELIKSHIKVKD